MISRIVEPSPRRVLTDISNFIIEYVYMTVAYKNRDSSANS